MTRQVRFAACVFFAVWAGVSAASAQTTRPATFDVRAFGAAGDGKALDTPAIDKAIDAASAAGGGTVLFPAGDYLSVTIHLKSNVALYLDQGATVVAADPKDGHRYDNPEPNEKWEHYQDFGHTHWRNSLIWGENLQNVSILGPGTIYGKGLVRSGGASRPKNGAGQPKNGSAKPARPKGPFGYPSPGDTVEDGWGNKALALKLCRNVTVRDVTFRHGGHFALLATGVDNLTIDNVKIDTNRDGMDIDCCRNVRVSNCTVNSPFDDGICLKSTHSLGFARACENVTITNCQVSGYDEGTYLDGTFKRAYKKYSHNSSTGRIKFGTESNGGFKNITISNCVFDYCRGLALETVDGGLLEDVAISNITMHDIGNAPIYLRLGARLRGPEGTAVGKLRRVTISNVVVHNAPQDQGIIIAGVPDHPVEDIVLDNIRIDYPGGGTPEMASAEFKNDVQDYPEPQNHGVTPAYGLFAQHVRGLEVRNFRVTVDKDDARPPIAIDNVKGVDFSNVAAAHAASVPVIVQKNVEDLTTHRVRGLADTAEGRVAEGKP